MSGAGENQDGEHERVDSVGYISGALDIEMFLNGRHIDWEYWAGKMPRLTTKQASLLVCGLDPDVYPGDLENIGYRSSGALWKAFRVERLAAAEGRTVATPEEWLSWAMNRGFEVPIGFEFWASGRNFSWEPLAEPKVKTAASAMYKPQSEVAVAGAGSGAKKARRDLLAPAIDAAQKECADPFDAPEVWAALAQMAQQQQHRFIGVSEDGLKWLDSNDSPQFFKLKDLRDRLRRKKTKAL